MEKYFGAEFSKEEALIHWFSNYLVPRYPVANYAAAMCVKRHPQVMALMFKTEKGNKKRK